MDEFSYLIVLISIILGLGITRLLTGLGQQIELRRHIRTYWPSIVWAVIVLLIHVQTWWSMFGMRDHEGWTFLDFLVVLLQPITLYLLAALALPTASAGAPTDLRTHYYEQSRWFFALLCVLLGISLLKDVALSGSLPSALNVMFHGVSFALAATGAVTKRERFHEANALLTAALVGVYIAALFSRLA